MNWDTAQQAVRILMNGVGVYLMSIGVPENIVLAITGFVLSGGAVAWWFFWERNRSGSSTI